LFALDAVNLELRHRGRRGAQRYALSWGARVTVHGPASEITELSGTVRDLSSSGAFIYLSGSVQVGRPVSVSIRLPLEKEIWMNLTGTVIRIMKQTDRDGIAIKFDQKRPEFVSR